MKPAVLTGSGGIGIMTFAQKLRELRDAIGMSEAKLARASGVPVATLHGYGLGDRKPSLANGIKLARALGVSADVFADCEDIAGEPGSKKSSGKRRSK